MSRKQLLWILPLLALLILWLADLGGGPRGPRREGEAAAAGEGREGAQASLVRPERRATPPGGAPTPREPTSPGASAPTPERAARAEPFRGRLLDRATGDPIPHARLVADELEAEVDGQGRFRCTAPLAAETETLLFLDPFKGTHIRSLPRAELVPDPEEGWIARIAIGPSYRLRVLGEDEPGLVGWRARLVEIGADERRSQGSWERLHPFDPPFLRYDNPWRPNAEGSLFLVEVRSTDGTRMGSSALLASAQGRYPEIVQVVVDRFLASVTGRVIDSTGAGVGHCFVRAVPAGELWEASPELAWPETRTDGEGRFQLQALAPGPYRIHARPRRGETPVTLRVELLPGPNELGDLVVPHQEGVGAIDGRLVSASGKRLETEHVRLRSLDGGLELLDVSASGRPQWWVDGHEGSGVGEEGHVFEFNEVPAGRYELSVVQSGLWSWDPPSVVVEAPDGSVVFTRLDEAAPDSLWLRVVAAGSETPLPGDCEVRLQLGRETWADARSVLPCDGSRPLAVPARDFEWTVSRPGFRAVHGDRGSLTRTPRGLERTVELHPGWSARFVLRDLDLGFLHDDESGYVSALSRPPVADARFLVRGEVVARSDADGAAELLLDGEPERIEILAPGWHVLGSAQFRAGRVQGPARDVLVWLTRE